MSGCLICGGHCEFAVNCLVSTRRVRPRAQKCSRSLPFCNSCILATRGDSGSEVALNLLESLYEAYTAIVNPSDEQGKGAE